MRQLISILSVLALLVLCVGPAGALGDEDFSKSGTISYYAAESVSYGWSSIKYNIGTLHNHYTYHDFTDAKEINSIRLSGWFARSDALTPINRYDTFTATIDGVYYGAGTITLNDKGSQNGESKWEIDYIIDFTDINSTYASTLTGDKRIDYSHNLDTSTGLQRAFGNDPKYNRNGLPNSDKPDCFYISGAGGEQYYQLVNGITVSSYSVSYENDYDYTYTASTGVSTIEVTKNNDASMFNVINSTGGYYVQETAYNTNPLSQAFYLGDEVKLSVLFNIGGGTYVNETIHSDSAQESEPVTLEPPYVVWDSTNYVVDDTGAFTWAIDSDNWQDSDYTYKCLVSRIADNGQYDLTVFNSEGLETQTGTLNYIFPVKNTYTVKLYKYSIWDEYIGVIFEPELLYSDVITITDGGQSQINAPESAERGEQFDIKYNFGYTPQDPIIRIKQLQGIQYIVKSTVPTVASPEAGTTYTTSATIHETGYFVVELYDTAKGSQATDTIDIIYTYVPPENPISTSFIDANKASYALGEYCRGSYAIDDTNFTSYNVYLEMWNSDKGIMAFSVPATKQLNDFDIGLFDYHFYDDGSELHPVNTQFMPGSHDIRLTAYNPDGTQDHIIKSDTVSIDTVTTEGYGLILSKDEVGQGEKFIISVVSPTSASLVIRDENENLIKSMSINGSIDYPYSLAKPGYYTVELTKDQELKAHQLLKVRDEGAEWMPGEGETTGQDAGTSMYMNFITFMTKPIFWGIIIYAGLVGGIAQIKDVNKSSLGLVAFIFLNLFAIAGLFAPYTAYVLVMGWIGAGIFFSLGRKMAGGDV